MLPVTCSIGMSRRPQEPDPTKEAGEEDTLKRFADMARQHDPAKVGGIEN